MAHTLKAVHVVDTPRWQIRSFQRFGNGSSLRIVKRNDAKTEASLMISSGDPNDHVHLFHILAPRGQLPGGQVSGLYTHLVTVSLLRLSSFRNVNE
jgi:hypothetical protein